MSDDRPKLTQAMQVREMFVRRRGEERRREELAAIDRLSAAIETLAAGDPTVSGAAAARPEPEQAVREYIRAAIGRGVQPAKLTRDGIAGALVLSGATVSRTKAWKALAATKRAARSPKQREREAIEAGARGDWAKILRIQSRELSGDR